MKKLKRGEAISTHDIAMESNREAYLEGVVAMSETTAEQREWIRRLPKGGSVSRERALSLLADLEATEECIATLEMEEDHIRECQEYLTKLGAEPGADGSLLVGIVALQDRAEAAEERAQKAEADRRAYAVRVLEEAREKVRKDGEFVEMLSFKVPGAGFDEKAHVLDLVAQTLDLLADRIKAGKA